MAASIATGLLPIAISASESTVYLYVAFRLTSIFFAVLLFTLIASYWLNVLLYFGFQWYWE
jgi:hypothetical protein